MKKITTNLEAILFYHKLFKIKGLRIASCLIMVFTMMCISSCTKAAINDEDDTDDTDNINNINNVDPIQPASSKIYYRWTTGSGCPFPYSSSPSLIFTKSDLPNSLTENTLYGPLAAGSIMVSRGTEDHNYTLLAPPTGYKRTYTHNVFKHDISLNRCLFTLFSNSDLTYVDQKL